MKILNYAMGAAFLLMSVAHAEVKMAFIDMEAVFEGYYRTAIAEEQLKRQADDFNDERKTMMETVESLKDDFNDVREAALDQALSEDARAAKRSEAEELLMNIRSEESKIRRFEQLRKKQLDDQGLRMREGIVADIRQVIFEHAKFNDYTAVLDSSGQTMNALEAVLYVDKDYDITEVILEELNKKESATK